MILLPSLHPRTAFIGSAPRSACWVSPVRVASRYHWSAFSHSKSFLDRHKATAVKTIWHALHSNTVILKICLLERWLRWNPEAEWTSCNKLLCYWVTVPVRSLCPRILKITDELQSQLDVAYEHSNPTWFMLTKCLMSLGQSLTAAASGHTGTFLKWLKGWWALS